MNVYGTLFGYNLFEYSFNNPINIQDSKGSWPRWITAAVAIAGMLTLNIPLAIGASEAFLTQTIHYDVRESLNTDLPSSPSEANQLQWNNSKEYDINTNPLGGGPSAACHQYTSPDNTNVKYVSQDGHKERIFDKYGNIVNDAKDIGTYNFCPYTNTVGSGIGHFVFDIAPWIIFGNNDEDPGPIINSMVKMFSK